MGYPTKIQLIKRKQSEQWYINFPAAVAQAMEFERGETVEWIVEDKESLVLRRQKVPPSALKKNCWNDCRLQSATPEQIRQDESIAWSTVTAFAAGKTHSFEVKTVAPVRWLGTGAADVRVVVIRPLAYRPRKGAHLLYRNPVYLLCTDPDLPLERLPQSYLWRWEVELNFRWVFRRSRPVFRDEGDRRSGVKPTDEPLIATDWL